MVKPFNKYNIFINIIKLSLKYYCPNQNKVSETHNYTKLLGTG